MFKSPQHRRQLLAFARQTARQALGMVDEEPAKPDIPGPCGGVFVTFWRGSTLRGCVGTFEYTTDVVTATADITRASLGDHRFRNNPIQAGELEQLTIEISILTPPMRTDDPLSLIPGRHGILIRHTGRSGCFLPKVATERGWSARAFLENCCTMKAGLPADAWRAADAEVMIFESESFSESGCAPM